MGIWEEMDNPNFNSPEFEGIKKSGRFQPVYLICQAMGGKNQFTRNYGKSGSLWRDLNPGLKGNIRDYADVSQLVCLSNLENLNARFIQEGFPQAERLTKLNAVAIQQMKLLAAKPLTRKLTTGEAR